MKAAEAKTPTTAYRHSTPFFGRENGQHFFGNIAKPKSFFQKSSTVQPKLSIGQHNDPYEREADSVADQVVQRLSTSDTLQTKPVATAGTIMPLVQTKCTACEEEEKPQKKNNEEDRLKDKLQKKPIFESNAKQPDEDIQRKCTACEKEEKLQKKSDDNSAQSAIESRLASAKGSGSSLPNHTRQQMESSFGVDFSGVRIHSDSAAVQLSKDLQAQAFTHGNDIYFNTGKYDTHSVGGKHLLAHELTHVMQQGLHTHQRIDRACLPSPPCPAPGSSTPIPGSAEDFSDREEAAEVSPRARRKRMSCSRATSTGHAGRALQLENFLRLFDPALRAKIHGIFIDADMSGGTGAFVTACNGSGGWEDLAMPTGCTVPQFAGATKPCVFVHGNLNQEAFQFNRTTNPTIGGLPREDWRIQTLQTLTHEVQHTIFDTAIAGRAVPAGTVGCPRSRVEAELTELNAIFSEFPLVIRAVPAAPGPARTNAMQRLNNWFSDAITNPDESLAGTLKAMRCTCNCAEVNAHIRDIFNFVSSSWSVPERTAFNTELRRPVWNVSPIDLNWPL